MALNWRTIGFPEHLMRVEEGSFRLANIQITSGSQLSNFVRAAGLIVQRWIGNFQMIKMDREEMQEWDSWIARLAGQAVLFEIHSPAQVLPLGLGGGFTEENPAYAITGTTITGVQIRTGAISGVVIETAPRYAQAIKVDFGTDQAGDVVLKHGDRFGLGGNLYMTVGQVTADANGHARVPFRWALHKGAAVGDIVNFRRPSCRAQLVSANEGQSEMSSPVFGKAGMGFVEVPYTQ